MNKKFKVDMSPVSEICHCYTCKTFTRSYLRHLFKLNDVLALHLASLHNVTFYLDLMRTIRQKIAEQSFADWAKKILVDLIGFND